MHTSSVNFIHSIMNIDHAELSGGGAGWLAGFGQHALYYILALEYTRTCPVSAPNRYNYNSTKITVVNRCKQARKLAAVQVWLATGLTGSLVFPSAWESL